MLRLLLSRLALLLPLTVLCPEAGAARTLESIDYFSPVTFRLVLTRELPAISTPKGSSNAVAVTRYGNRDVLAPVVAEHGGKLSDWSLVAYANSESFDSFDDLALVARHKNGAMYPVDLIDFSALTVASATSDPYSVTKAADESLLRASFEQKHIVTCEQALFGGSLVASGKATNKVSFGPLTFSGRTVRAFRPGAGKLTLVGMHTADESSEASVAALTITFDAPRLHPRFSAPSSGTDGGGNIIIVIDPTQVTPVSPN